MLLMSWTDMLLLFDLSCLAISNCCVCYPQIVIYICLYLKYTRFLHHIVLYPSSTFSSEKSPWSEPPGTSLLLSTTVSSCLYPEEMLSVGRGPSEGSCCRIKLWMAHNAAGILACTSGAYSGGKWRMQNLCLSTPNMRSVTLRADAWRRLKSSSLFAGLY